MGHDEFNKVIQWINYICSWEEEHNTPIPDDVFNLLRNDLDTAIAQYQKHHEILESEHHHDTIMH